MCGKAVTCADTDSPRARLLLCDRKEKETTLLPYRNQIDTFITRALADLARTDNDESNFSRLPWRGREAKTKSCFIYSATVAPCCFFGDSNWFNWKENGALCLNSKHLWEDQAGPCFTWSIKKPKLSKMNSTCSMKAWHRCVSLWGPPGRLCTASSVVETGFKSAFFPPPLLF